MIEIKIKQKKRYKTPKKCKYLRQQKKIKIK